MARLVRPLLTRRLEPLEFGPHEQLAETGLETHGQAGHPHDRRRSAGAARGRAGPAGPVRVGLSRGGRRQRRVRPRRRASPQAAGHARRPVPRRPADAGHDRHRVPRGRRGHPPRREAGPAHGLRGHRGRHRGDQHHPPRPLPPQALGSARGAAVPGPRGPAVGLAGRLPSRRSRGSASSATRWSARGHAIKDYLARNQLPYRWLDIETDPEAIALAASAGVDAVHEPLVVLADGSHLVGPSNAEIAERVGLRTHAALPYYDLVIAGGGPAGLAAAVYGASEGLKTLLIEREAPGGQAGTTSRIENYLGFPAGPDRRRPCAPGAGPGDAPRRGGADAAGAWPASRSTTGTRSSRWPTGPR